MRHMDNAMARRLRERRAYTWLDDDATLRDRVAA
jgi:hypothetical protein